MSVILTLISAFAGFIGVFVLFFKYAYTYWERRGIPSTKPKIPFGDAYEITTRKITRGEGIRKIYNEFKAKNCQHVGLYFFASPMYVPIDPNIVKCILQTDFDHFEDKGSYVNEKHDPLSANLSQLHGERWRSLRQRLTQAFSTGQLKNMFQTLANCRIALDEALEGFAQNEEDVDIKNTLQRFTADVIGSCAFGLNCNSFKNTNAEFMFYGNKAVTLDYRSLIKFILRSLLPWNLLRAAGVPLFSSECIQFFTGVVKDTVDYRESRDVYRKDFMHLLLQLKNRGKIYNDARIKPEPGESIGDAKIDMREIVAQSFIFFVAGFETSATTMTFALYELAQRQDIQDKVRQEINQVLAKHGGDVTYDAIMDMKYLQQVIDETMRRHPAVMVLDRKCTKDWKIPNTNTTLEKGTGVFIPIFSLHMDSEYFPEPEKFDPDRFSEENKKNIPPFTFLPFGDGPRICIGLRFALLQSKVGLTTVLSKYRVTLSPKCPNKLIYDTGCFVASAKGGIWLRLEKIV